MYESPRDTDAAAADASSTCWRASAPARAAASPSCSATLDEVVAQESGGAPAAALAREGEGVRAKA